MLKKQLAILLTVCLMPIAALGEECPLYIRHVENLPEDFILGMDVSSVLSLEAAGVRYYDFDGQ